MAFQLLAPLDGSHVGTDINRLLTIYDLAVEARWTGKVGDEEVTGTVRVPEVSHEAIDGLSDYEVGLEFEYQGRSS
jgi:hypothetical protein